MAPLDWASVLTGAVIGAVLSVLLGIPVAMHLADKAKAHAKTEAERQLGWLRTILLTLEDAGLVKLARDQEGAITGGRAITQVVNESVNIGSSFSAELKAFKAEIRGEGNVTPAKDKQGQGPA